MRLLALVLLLVLVPQDERTRERRSLTLTNSGDTELAAGIQVCIKRPGNEFVRILHRGRVLPMAIDGQGHEFAWFRLPEALGPGKSDSRFELHSGNEKAVESPREVFEFFDDLRNSDLDPNRWEWDRDLGLKKGERGLAITALPGGRNEYATADLKPKLKDFPQGFVLEVDLNWEIDQKSAFAALVHVDLENKLEVAAADRARVETLIKDLGSEEIEGREGATKELVKLGAIAYPQLEEAARSKEGETRARVLSALSAILRENPPHALAFGFWAAAEPRWDFSVTSQLGKSRTKTQYTHSSQGRIVLTRDDDGISSAALLGRPPSARVPGRATGFRFRFWSPAAGQIGKLAISRVALRRYVEVMPTAEFGEVEKLK